jgi:actin-related protein 8
MVISTQHLLPPPPNAAEEAMVQTSVAAQSGRSRLPLAKYIPMLSCVENPVSEDGTKQEQQDVALAPTDASNAPQITIVNGESDSSAPMEIIDVEGESKSTPVGLRTTGTQQNSTAAPTIDTDSYAGDYAIDVCFEASKLPLDVAIFNSARAAGGDDKIRKYLQAVLVIGGTALVPGMAHALESRLESFLSLQTFTREGAECPRPI